MLYPQAITALTEFIGSEQISKDFGFTEISFPFDSCFELLSKQSPKIPKKPDGMFTHTSGLYFLSSPENEIYYIGKATKNNLHEEIWGKIKTATRKETDQLIYPKNYFLNKSLDEQAVTDITNGNILLRVLGMNNPDLASLAEVYIQTLFYKKNGNELPKLNSRIG
jgi:hypothetical protein